MATEPLDQAAATQPVFIVTMSVSRQWGDPQQKSLDDLLHFAARLTPDQGIKLLDEIAGVVNTYRVGATAPISGAGAKALDSLGKDKQLPLLSCEVRNSTRT
jgi:hypothetical protein